MNDGSERVLTDSGEEHLKLQLALDKLQRVEWIQSLAPWEVMGTGTFRWSASLWSAKRCFEKFMERKLPQLSYFYACERNPSRDGFHVHSLWADCKGVYRRDVWADWFGRYGRNLVEPVRSKRDVSDYASKYLVKDSWRDDTWWNVKLQWHHWAKLHDAGFQLDSTALEGSFGFSPEHVSPRGESLSHCPSLYQQPDQRTGSQGIGVRPVASHGAGVRTVAAVRIGGACVCDGGSSSLGDVATHTHTP